MLWVMWFLPIRSNAFNSAYGCASHKGRPWCLDAAHTMKIRVQRNVFLSDVVCDWEIHYNSRSFYNMTPWNVDHFVEFIVQARTTICRVNLLIHLKRRSQFKRRHLPPPTLDWVVSTSPTWFTEPPSTSVDQDVALDTPPNTGCHDVTAHSASVRSLSLSLEQTSVHTPWHYRPEAA